MLYYIIDQNGKVLWTSDKKVSSSNNTVVKLSLSNEDKEKIRNGWNIDIQDGVFAWVLDTSDSDIAEKKQSLNNMTLQELIDNEEDFSDLWIAWEQLWEILSNKFFGGNIYKELQLHRVMLQKLMRVVIKGETLTATDLAEVLAMEEMDNQAETILQKF